MVRIYIAGPLFCDSEKEYNIKLAEALRTAGYEVILPQESTPSFDSARMCESTYAQDVAEMICRDDLTLIDGCDILVFNLDGRVPDEGACVELGYAHAKGLRTFAIKTDIRVSEFGIDNMMIAGIVGKRTARSIPELLEMLKAQ